MNHWLFQGNPKYYKILAAIQDFEQMPWRVTRYTKEITVGDGVLIWMAGPEAGIYAIAQIIAPPQMLTEIPDRSYWIDKSTMGSRPQAQIRFTHKLIEKPLLRSHLKQDTILKNLAVLRQPNATNFKVTPQQWQRVNELKP